MQQNMGCLMDQRFDHGRVVHVCSDEDPMVRPVGLTVGSLQIAGVGDGVDRESLRLDQRLDRCTKPAGSLAGKNPGSGRIRRSLPRRLAGVEDRGDCEASDYRRSRLGLTGVRPVPSPQRSYIAVGITGLPARPARRSQDGVAVLSSFNGAAESSPRLEARDVRRYRFWNPSLLVSFRVLSEDQHDVVGRVVVQHGLEIEKPSPVISGDQGSHLGGQNLLRRSHLRRYPLAVLLSRHLLHQQASLGLRYPSVRR
jgi:hypothetical protein